ncbi:MAG TPA: type IV pilus modification protein PilV [Halothiobacillaceae bacterium]|nr:type IV pilus modification protein PilV [Halothiobacillaceae bacterium]
MPRIANIQSIQQQRGITLLEVLIAVLVLAIGLIGTAAMQNKSLALNHGAYLESQATNLAYDIADRMRANRTAAKDGKYDRDFGDKFPTNNTGTIANQDLYSWGCMLQGGKHCAVNGIEPNPILPGADGRISRDDNEIIITIRWRNRDADDDQFYTTEITTEI